MGSVPNCQKEIAVRYPIRWFKCKLKPPKNGVLVFILLHIYANLWLKIPKFGGSKKIGNFLTSQKLPLYGPANGQLVTYSKIQIKVSGTP